MTTLPLKKIKKALFLILTLVSLYANAQDNYLLFVGTYTRGTASKGIYVYEFNAKKSTFKLLSTTPAVNPSYLTLSKDQRFLYAVNENTDNSDTGFVSAFDFDRLTGQLHFINKQLTVGDAPCHISIDESSGNVLAANYSSGDMVIFKTYEDGSIDPAEQYFHFNGSGPKSNQKTSHLHGCFISPDQSDVFTTDLGADKIYHFKFKPLDDAALRRDSMNDISVSPGSGPRHIAFHPYSRLAYLLNENAANIITYKYEKGTLIALDTTDMVLPKRGLPNMEDRGAAAIRVSSDGKFLFTSERGQANTIYTFTLNKKGIPVPTAEHEVKRSPRDFILTPDNKYLLAASQLDNSIDIYKIEKDGTLTDLKKNIEVPSPVSLLLTTL